MSFSGNLVSTNTVRGLLPYEYLGGQRDAKSHVKSLIHLKTSFLCAHKRIYSCCSERPLFFPVGALGKRPQCIYCWFPRLARNLDSPNE